MESYEQLIGFFDSPTFDFVKIGVLSYLGLLWLSIIIWVTRDSIHRSKSLIFQTFSILINILIPFLGVLLYLIIRPSKTSSELYYEELEHQLLDSSEPSSECCQKCGTGLAADFVFCPNCGEVAKIKCEQCAKLFSSSYSVCPYCGEPRQPAQNKAEDKSKRKSRSAKSASNSEKSPPARTADS